MAILRHSGPPPFTFPLGVVQKRNSVKRLTCIHRVYVMYLWLLV